MNILFLRHGDAGDPQAAANKGLTDELRPLTDKGHKQIRRAGKALRELCPEISVLAASPLLRAMQTAEAVAKAYKHLQVMPCEHLAPGSPLPSLLRWLRTQPGGTIVLVGHEPTLSTAASWLVTGKEESVLRLGKGGACLIETEGKTITPGSACLLWCLEPQQLRSLRK